MQAALIACLAMGLLGCVDLDSAYRSIHWKTLVLIVGHVLVWTLWASLSHGNLASSVDPVENWNWGKEWQWGYYKHPPFFAWVVGAWFTLWPRADWAYFLLSATNAALGLAAVWAMVGVIETGRRRLLAVAALVLTPMYGMLALKFNANAVLLSLWPWAVWAFLAALKSPTVLRGAVLGLLLAAAMLSKYVSVVLVLAMLAVMRASMVFSMLKDEWKK